MKNDPVGKQLTNVINPSIQTTSCHFIYLLFFLNSLPASGNICHLLMTFANSSDPDQPSKRSGLIWILTVGQSDGISERTFE